MGLRSDAVRRAVADAPGRRGFPYLPRSDARAAQVVKLLLFLERTHSFPEAVARTSHQVVVFDESAERFLHELLALADLRKEWSEISAVDADVGMGYRLVGVGTAQSMPITECLYVMQISRHAIMYNKSRRATSVPPKGSVNEAGSI
jgi:hypothetical protein